MRVLTLAALAVAASAQTGPEILKKTAETYQSLKSYHFESQIVSESVSENSESRTRSSRISAAMLPDRRRLESKGGQFAALRVYDGHTVWEFRPGANQFARRDQATYKPPSINLLSDLVDGYKVFGNAAGAKVLREESLEAAGAARQCWVVEVPSRLPAGGMILERSPTTYWVDKSTNLIWKELYSSKMKTPASGQVQNQTTTTTYTVARVNESVPAELFQFDPPEGATEIAEFTSPFSAGSTLLGKSAPAFTLPDLAGKEFDSTSLKGKPVLVNFWATWCGPCREQMPKIQDAQREFADKGLVVLAINYGEPAETARKYIEEHKYTFHVLLDPDRTVVRRFSVTSIPVLLLIDRDGKVRGHHIGYSTLFDLREELKKLGL